MRILYIAVFLGIISLFGLSVYSGFIEIKNPRNFLGLIGVGDSNSFKFVGSVDLKNNSPSSDSNYQLAADKKITSPLPAKTKKEKEPQSKQITVKVISGIISVATSAISAASAMPVITSIATSSINNAPIEENIDINAEQNNQSISSFIQEKIQENIPIQYPAENSQPVLEQNININNDILVQAQNNSQNISISESIITRILISEIMAGIDGNSSYEFVELFNPTANSIDLTGWSVKKKSSSGSESTLVSASRFEGKTISANKYFLLANEGGYDGQISADVFWPKSYALAYADNTIVIYNSNNELVESVNWTEILKGQSIERESFDTNQFKIQSIPNPQNSF